MGYRDPCDPGYMILCGKDPVTLVKQYFVVGTLGPGLNGNCMVGLCDPGG